MIPAVSKTWSAASLESAVAKVIAEHKANTQAETDMQEMADELAVTLDRGWTN